MATEIKLPQLGQTMEEGTVVSCLVKIGDEIKKGDVIFEVETDKATLEMESPEAGFVKHVFAQDGQTLEVGAAMLVVGDENEDVDVESLQVPAEPVQASPPPSVGSSAGSSIQPSAAKKAGRVFASPRARARAKKLGVELSSIAGTGPGGRIVEADVIGAGTSAKVAPSESAYKLGAAGSIEQARQNNRTANDAVQA